MAIPKKIRLEVHLKYNERCAYCGNELLYKNMQVDHLKPQRRKGSDEIGNLMPACRRCNHYKRALSLKTFRDRMKTIHERIEKDYINKVAIDYGIVTVRQFDGKFYFEKQQIKNEPS